MLDYQFWAELGGKWLDFPETIAVPMESGLTLIALSNTGAVVVHVSPYGPNSIRFREQPTQTGREPVMRNLTPSPREVGLGELSMSPEEVSEWLTWLYGAAHGLRPALPDRYLWTARGLQEYRTATGHTTAGPQSSQILQGAP